VSLIILASLPFVSVATLVLIKMNQQRGARSSEIYSHAGGIAYEAVSSVRTVLSLNGVPELIQRYADATAEALSSSVSFLVKQGLANGACGSGPERRCIQIRNDSNLTCP